MRGIAADTSRAALPTGGGDAGDRSGVVGEAVDDQRCHQLGLIAAERRGRPLDGLDHLHVAALPVQDPRQRVADLLLGRVGIAVEQRLGGQHHGARRVPGLQCAGVDERFLDGMQIAGGHVQALHGGDLVAAGLRGEQHVRRDQAAVEEDGGGAGFAGVRAVADAEAALAAKHRQQRVAGGAGDEPGNSVKKEIDVHQLPPIT